MPDDPYSRVDYRRLIAWPERIEREWPFLQRTFGGSGRLLDLGCGTGEHTRFLASRGFDVTGVDSSPAMLAKATDTPVPANVHFVAGDIVQIDALVEGQYDGALCVGNTLPHLGEDARLAELRRGLRGRLRPGAPFLLQILNYERILGKQLRFLPLDFRGADQAGGEVVFLRLMTPIGNGRIVFTPTTLRYRAAGDPPLEVVSSRNVTLRAWTRDELSAALRDAGFRSIESFGTVDAAVPYVGLESRDVVIVAR
jgi:SAM-dependent methyltransferase